MIHYKEIESRYKSTELNDEELIVLEKMEKYTDRAIELQFRNSFNVYVDFKDLNKLASMFGIHRKDVLIEQWKRICNHAGWSISYDGSDSWILSEKKETN
jgi:hypothetical protein